MAELSFECMDCGETKLCPPNAGGTGYAVDRDTQLKVCYDCCAARDKKDMESYDKFLLYLCKEAEPVSSPCGYVVSNWPGTLKFPVQTMKKGGHNISGSRRDVWFKDHVGSEWHGVQYGNFSQICYCKKRKIK